MKYENPIMNFSKFDLENVVTASGGNPSTVSDKDAAMDRAAAITADAALVLSFN